MQASPFVWTLCLAILSGGYVHAQSPAVYSVEARQLVMHEEILRSLQLTTFATTPAEHDAEGFKFLDDVTLPAEGMGIHLAVSRTLVESQPPVSMEGLSEEQAKTLCHSLESDRECNLMVMPKVLLEAGEMAKLVDETTRAFVTGFVPGTAGSDLTTLKPMVRGVREGTRMLVRVRPLNETLCQFDCRLVQTSIRNVREASTGRGSSMVQVPEMARNVLEFSSHLKENQHLLVWWPETKLDRPEPARRIVRTSALAAARRGHDRLLGLLIRVTRQAPEPR